MFELGKTWLLAEWIGVCDRIIQGPVPQVFSIPQYVEPQLDPSKASPRRNRTVSPPSFPQQTLWKVSGR